jgi:hypothetical protein
MLDVLDLCDTARSAAKRQNTSVATQALTMFNGEFVNKQARYFAERLRKEAGNDPNKQIDLAWRLALARPPKPPEISTMLEFLTGSALERGAAASTIAAGHVRPSNGRLEQMCRVIFNLNEFVYAN